MSIIPESQQVNIPIHVAKRRLPGVFRPSKSQPVGMARSYFKYIAILPAILLFVTFFIIPSIGGVYFSLTDYFGDPRFVEFVGLKHYISILTRESIRKDLLNAIRISIIFSLGVTIPQNIIAVFLAVLANMKLRLKSFYRAVLFLPNVLGIVAIGLTWRLMFSPSLGIVNAALKALFGINSALLGDPKLALFLVIFVQLWISTGWAMVVYIAGLQTIPQELREAVRVDGASAWQTFFYLTLPLLQPAITINILISLIGSLKIVDTIYILTNFDASTKNLPVYIFLGVTGAGNQGLVAAFGLVHFLLVSIVVVIAQYFLRRRERYLE